MLAVTLSMLSGQIHESKVANTLMKSTIKKQTKAVVADRGYDSSDIRACVFKHCAESVIPVKSNSKTTIPWIGIYIAAAIW